jgi:hypothetical protein
MIRAIKLNHCPSIVQVVTSKTKCTSDCDGPPAGEVDQVDAQNTTSIGIVMVDSNCSVAVGENVDTSRSINTIMRFEERASAALQKGLTQLADKAAVEADTQSQYDD